VSYPQVNTRELPEAPANDAIVTLMESPRFLTPADAAEVLNTSVVQILALIRRGEIRAIQIGGRGQWRIEVAELEAYIQRMYDEADARRSDLAPSEDDQSVESD